MGGGQPKPAPKASPMDNPLGQILEGMFGGGAQRQAPQSGGNPFGNNPLGQIFQDMLGGTMGGGGAASDSEEAAYQLALDRALANCAAMI